MNTMDLANKLDKLSESVDKIPAKALLVTEAELIRDPKMGLVVAREGEVIGTVVDGLYVPRDGVSLSQEDLLSIVELLEDVEETTPGQALRAR